MESERSPERLRPSRRVRPDPSGGDDRRDPESVAGERERGSDGWGPRVSGVERAADTDSGAEPCWVVGSFSGWTKLVPRGPLAFFSIFFSDLL
jgi:hypothetical protein